MDSIIRAIGMTMVEELYSKGTVYLPLLGVIYLQEGKTVQRIRIPNTLTEVLAGTKARAILQLTPMFTKMICNVKPITSQPIQAVGIKGKRVSTV